jgi:hypothetical protein
MMTMDPMERPQSPSPEESAQPWLQYASPPPPRSSRFDELIQNPMAVLAIGIVIGVLIVSMRPIIVQGVKP